MLTTLLSQKLVFSDIFYVRESAALVFFPDYKVQDSREFIALWESCLVDQRGVDLFYDFFDDPTRSGRYALNEERYAASALACLRFICRFVSEWPPYWELCCWQTICNFSSQKYEEKVDAYHTLAAFGCFKCLPDLLDASSVSRSLTDFIDETQLPTSLLIYKENDFKVLLGWVPNDRRISEDMIDRVLEHCSLYSKVCLSLFYWLTSYSELILSETKNSSNPHADGSGEQLK